MCKDSTETKPVEPEVPPDVLLHDQSVHSAMTPALRMAVARILTESSESLKVALSGRSLCVRLIHWVCRFEGRQLCSCIGNAHNRRKGREVDRKIPCVRHLWHKAQVCEPGRVAMTELA